MTIISKLLVNLVLGKTPV